MFYMNCGQKINDGDSNCRVCGNPVEPVTKKAHDAEYGSCTASGGVPSAQAMSIWFKRGGDLNDGPDGGEDPKVSSVDLHKHGGLNGNDKDIISAIQNDVKDLLSELSGE